MELTRATYRIQGGELSVIRTYGSDISLQYKPYDPTDATSTAASIEELLQMAGPHLPNDDDAIGSGLIALVALIEHNPDHEAHVSLAARRAYDLQTIMRRLEKRYVSRVMNAS